MNGGNLYGLMRGERGNPLPAAPNVTVEAVHIQEIALVIMWFLLFSLS